MPGAARVYRSALDYLRELDALQVRLRGPTREMVERMRGEWIKKDRYTECSKCEYWYDSPELEDDEDRPAFCQACGAPMTDEAVDIMLRRWEELHEKIN